MATIKNTVKTNFETAGAQKTVKATGQVTKAETRLGQATASAGRQFSAQAQGLGGLVSAYAGAAANIFAITQAFSALSRAAQAEQTIQGTRTLAAQIGESGDQIIAKVQEITRGQLSIAESAQNANIALSAGFNTNQFERLTNVALKASIALGRNLPDALTRLTRGTAKIEPEILDELGIFVRLDTAVETYADKIGKAAGSLTQFERSQAFLNAALEQGETKFSAIDPTIEGSVASFERLGAKITDLGQKFGALLAITLVPFADFLSGNFLNTLSAFGILAGVVFAKLGSVVREGIGSATAGIERFGSVLSEKYANANKTAEAATRALGNRLGQLDLRTVRGSRKQQEYVKGLIRFAKENRLTTGEALKLQKALQTQDQTNRAVQRSLAAVNAQLAGTSVFAQQAARAFGFLSTAAKGVGTALNGILRFAGIFGLVISGLQLVSSAIAKLFGVDLFQEFGDRLERALNNLGNYFQTAKESALAAERALDRMTGAFAKQQDFLEKAGDKDFSSFLNPMTFTGKDVLEDARKAQERFTRQSEALIGRLAFSDDPETRAREIAEKAITSVAVNSKKLSEEFENDPELRGKLITALLSIDTSKEAKKLEAKLKEMFAKVQLETGTGGLLFEQAISVNPDKAAFTLNRGFQKTFEKVNKEFKTRGGSADFTTAIGIDEATLEPQIGAAIGQFSEFFKAAETGSLTASTAAQRVQGLRDILAEFGESEFDGETSALAELFDKLLKASEDTVRFTASVELLNKTFDSTFGSATKAGRALGKLIDPDTLTTGVKLVFRENEIRRNNLKILVQTAKTLEDTRAGANLRKKALDAIAGSYEKIGKAVDKIEKSLDKQERKLRNQIAILEKQASLQDAQATLKERQALNKENDEILKSQLASTKRLNDISKAQLELEKARNNAAKQNADIRENAINREIKALERAQELEERRINKQRDANIQRLNLAQTTQGALPGFFTERQGRQLEIAITQESISALKAVIENQEQNFKKFEEKQEQIAKARTEAAVIEFENTKASIESQQSLLAFQTVDLAEQKARAEERKKEIVEERELQNAVLKAQENLAQEQISARQEEAFAQLELQKLNMDLLAEEAKVLEAHPQALAKVLEANIDAERSLRGLDKMSQQERDKFKTGGAADSLLEAVAKAQGRIGQAGDEFTPSTGLFGSQARIGELQRGAAKKRLEDAKTLGKIQDRNAQRQQDDLIAQKKAQMEINRITIEKLDIELKQNQKLLDDKLAGIDADKRIALQGRQDEITAKKAELLAEQNKLANQTLDDRLKSDTMLQAAQKITTQVGDRLGQSLQDLFTAMREGTLTADNFKQGVKDLFLGILGDIQTTLLEETVINPMKDFFKEQIGGLFGFGDETKGADNATVTGGALHVVEQGGSGAVKSTVDELEKAGQKQVETADNTAFSFSSMFEKLEQSSNPLIALFGSLGGAITQAIGGLGRFASSLLDSVFGGGGGSSGGGLFSAAVKGAGSLFGQAGVDLFTTGSSLGSPFSTPFVLGDAPNVFASGGYIRKMAAGGMMRDRVPAMLEPGEFVMQRKAVNRIGAQNLSAMNGTGNGMPNISVEVKNEGTPKDAQAQVRPQMDVNKMVVEIVTRDIRNNGPIRKTLRTGAE